MCMRTILLFLGIFVFSSNFFGQDSLLFQREKELHGLLADLRYANSDFEKDQANAIFKKKLYETIQLPGAFNHGFSSLKSIGTIKSPDNEFRLFNWNIERDDQSNIYFCYILKKEERSTNFIVIELIDNSFMLPARPEEILNEDQWYGALYYKIIPVKKSNKTFYTVLGLDANNAVSTVKMIDVLYFSGKHARLGNAIFKTKTGTQKRVFFEYSKRATMSLNYDAERNRIVFDHLSPESPGMEEHLEYYVPDMSLDAFKFQNNKWVLVEDVVGVNSAEKKQRNKAYFINKKTGEMDSITVKSKWIDPSNPTAPAGGNQHSAALPDDELVSDQKKKKEKTEKIKRKKEKEFSMTPSIATGNEDRKRKKRK